jgi:hypothetical protein
LCTLKSIQKNPQILGNDPTRTILTTSPNLWATSHRLNVDTCRKAATKRIILDEHSFRVGMREGIGISTWREWLIDAPQILDPPLTNSSYQSPFPTTRRYFSLT